MGMPSHLTMATFLGLMQLKLKKNEHKDGLNRENIPSFVALLRREVEEFEEQVAEDRFNPNSLLELADISNFALLLFEYLRKEGVPLPHEETAGV